MIAIAVSLLTPPTDGHAEIIPFAIDGFVVEVKQHINAPASNVYATIPEIGQWWSRDPSWSGDASNFSMSAEAGTCASGRRKDGSVEHGRVVMAVWMFTLKPADSGTDLLLSFVVNGATLSPVDKSAPGVGEVLSE